MPWFELDWPSIEMSPLPERIFTDPSVEFIQIPFSESLTDGPVGKFVPEAPPPKYKLPAREDVVSELHEPIVLMQEFASSPIHPLPLVPAQRTKSEPLV